MQAKRSGAAAIAPRDGWEIHPVMGRVDECADELEATLLFLALRLGTVSQLLPMLVYLDS